MKTRTQLVVVTFIVFTLLLVVVSLHALWIADGSPVCTAPNNQDLPGMTTDGAGGAIIAWTDVRSGDFDIYAQRVDERGAPLWTSDGIAVCAEPGVQTLPQIVSDGAGGAILGWIDRRDSKLAIYAQRIDTGGNVMWVDSGVVVCDTTEDSEYPAMAPDGSGGVIIVWQDRRGVENELYAQRLNASGEEQWKHNGVAVTNYEDYEVTPRVIPDGVGGVIVVWEDDRAGHDVYAQRLNADGDKQWASGGVLICDADEAQRRPDLASDGAGGAIIAWSDQRGLGELYIYAQRVDGAGTVQWNSNGVRICPVTNGQLWPAVLGDGAGGAIIAWEEGSGDAIHAQRIDATGAPLWTASGVDVCTAPGAQNYARIISDGAGGAIVAWEDNRSGFADVYIQRLSAAGAVQWTADGEAVCTALWNQEYIQMVSDGNGGAILAWEDERSGELDIYGSRMDANGQQVPTFLETCETSVRGGAVVVHWSVSAPADPGQFSAYRKSEPGGRSWTPLDVEISGTDEVFSFADATCQPGRSYRYRVDVDDETGTQTLFETSATTIPEADPVLFHNVPNPFNPSTTISFTLPAAGPVELAVFDVRGERVRTLARGTLGAGKAEYEWDGRDEEGIPVSSGVYFCRLEAGKRIQVQKMLLIK